MPERNAKAGFLNCGRVKADSISEFAFSPVKRKPTWWETEIGIEGPPKVDSFLYAVRAFGSVGYDCK